MKKKKKSIIPALFLIICVLFTYIPNVKGNAIAYQISSYFPSYFSPYENIATITLPTEYNESYNRDSQINYDLDLDTNLSNYMNHKDLSVNPIDRDLNWEPRLSSDLISGYDNSFSFNSSVDLPTYSPKTYGYKDAVGILDWGSDPNVNFTDISTYPADSVNIVDKVNHENVLEIVPSSTSWGGVNMNWTISDGELSFWVLSPVLTDGWIVSGSPTEDWACWVTVGIFFSFGEIKYLDSGANWVYSGNTYLANTWYHFHIDYTIGARQLIYLNGILITNQTCHNFAPSYLKFASSKHPMYIDALGLSDSAFIKDTNRLDCSLITDNITIVDNPLNIKDFEVEIEYDCSNSENMSFYQYNNDLIEFELKNNSIDSSNFTFTHSSSINDYFENLNYSFKLFVSNASGPFQFNVSITLTISYYVDYGNSSYQMQAFYDKNETSDYFSRNCKINGYSTINYNSTNWSDSDTIEFQSIIQLDSDTLFEIDIVDNFRLQIDTLTGEIVYFIAGLEDSSETFSFNFSNPIYLNMNFTEGALYFEMFPITNSSNLIIYGTPLVSFSDSFELNMNFYNGTNYISATNFNGYITKGAIVKCTVLDITHSEISILSFIKNDYGYNTFEYDAIWSSNGIFSKNITYLPTYTNTINSNNAFFPESRIIGAIFTPLGATNSEEFTLNYPELFTSSNFNLVVPIEIVENYSLEIDFLSHNFTILMNTTDDFTIFFDGVPQAYTTFTTPDLNMLYFSVFKSAVNSSTLCYSFIYDEIYYKDSIDISTDILIKPVITVSNYFVWENTTYNMDSINLLGIVSTTDLTRINEYIPDIYDGVDIGSFFDQEYFTPYSMYVKNDLYTNNTLPILLATLPPAYSEYYITYQYIYEINVSAVNYINNSNIPLWNNLFMYNQYQGSNGTYASSLNASKTNMDSLFEYIQFSDSNLNIITRLDGYDTQANIMASSYSISVLSVLYISEKNLSIMDFATNMILPMLLLFIFPWAFYKTFGKYGVAIGLYLAFIVMYIANMLSIVQTIILMAISTLVITLIFKARTQRGESTDI